MNIINSYPQYRISIRNTLTGPHLSSGSLGINTTLSNTKTLYYFPTFSNPTYTA
jgi:hypothetical protein